MKLTDFLAELAGLGANIWLEDEKLRIRAPKGALTPEHRELLGKYKQELLKLLQERERESSLLNLPLTTVSRDQILPLSFEQERLWIVNQILGDRFSYNLVQGISLTGSLDLFRLKESLRIIVERHESLRTTFVMVEGQPSQKINSFPVFLEVESVGGLEESVEQEAQFPFDIEKGPLWHFRLLQLGDINHVLLITFHHLIGDIFSATILIQELIALYQSESEFCPLPSLHIQYPDFAVCQRQWLSSGKLDIPLDYWKQHLKEAPTSLNLPTDHPQSLETSFFGRHHTFHLDRQLWTNLKQWSQEQGITPTTALLMAWEIFLYLLSHQEDFVLGFSTSGRSHPDLEAVIGFFGYPLPLRADLAGNPSLSELLERISQTLRETYSNQFVPFSKVVEATQRQSVHSSPLFRVLFSTFLGKQLDSRSLPDLTVTVLPEASRSPTDIDLLWSLYESDGNLYGVLGYRADLFDQATIKDFVQSYCDILHQCLQANDRRLADFQLTEALSQKVQRYYTAKPLLAIAATFTAEPLRETLEFWSREISLNYPVEFAPYNQIFQQLLDEQSLLSQNRAGVNIVLLRFEDWLRFSSTDTPLVTLEKNVTDFISALKVAISRTSTPYLVGVCPGSSARVSEQWQTLEGELLQALADLPGVYSFNAQEILTLYPVIDYEDVQGDQLGHIPYTAIFYTSLGTLLVRKLYRLKQSPYKVIVLDCDNTLWQGVCGEDGVEGIALTSPYQSLQAFMQKQSAGGMLLCLCSKNAESDVRQVFAKRTDMLLKWDNFVNWRINWQAKSENLRSLAQDLELGLDSFIVIDDNPVEIAEIQANCPEVLALCLPPDPLDIPAFLQQVWAFDQLKITTEDQQRTSFYRENVQRQQIFNTSTTLGDFINTLNLQVRINPMGEAQVSRVAQLTQRTNQFNATTVRRSESEIIALWQARELNCLVVEVSDRFGDYGLVGVILYGLSSNTLKVDSFILSCRTLGRGVEHQMLAKLGQIAREQGLAWLEIDYYPTPKNQPILTFLESIDQALRETTPGGSCFRFAVDVACEVVYQSRQLTPAKTSSPVTISSSTELRLSNEQVKHIATHLSEPQEIWQQIQSQLKKAQEKEQPLSFVAPQTAIEKQLAQIWAELLHVERVGINDNFFALGGDSILIIQVVAQAHRAGLRLTPMQIFENQTIAQLATVVSQGDLQGLSTGSVALTPMQHWFFGQNFANPHHFNQSILLEVAPHLDTDKLEKALTALMFHHDALRLRFEKRQGEWQQYYSELSQTILLPIYDLSSLLPLEQEESLKATANQLQASLDLHQGPLLQAALWKMGLNSPDRLLIIIHHLVIDGISWRILLEDLSSAYQQLEADQIIQFPAKTASFKYWVQQLEKKYAQANLPPEPLAISSLPREDDDSTLNTVGLSSCFAVFLDKELTQALQQDVPSTYNTQTHEVLLTALVQAFTHWTGHNTLLLDIEADGRQDLLTGVNVSHTLGQFTRLSSVLLQGNSEGQGDILKSIKEQLRNHLSPQKSCRKQQKSLTPAQVSFKYLEHFGQIVTTPPILGIDLFTQRGEEQGPLNQRAYLIEILAYEVNGKLKFSWIYNPKIHTQTTMEMLAELMLQSLTALINHCQLESAGGYTPSDFPEANLTAQELEQVLNLLE